MTGLDDDFPFETRIPGPWIGSHAIEREGERWYIERGRTGHFKHWIHELHKAFPGELIPLQWVPHYVGVSREAVLKRAKNGGLTVFSFVPTEHHRTILGGFKARESRQRYDYVLIHECEAWRDLLLVKAGTITEEERQEAIEERRLEMERKRQTARRES